MSQDEEEIVYTRLQMARRLRAGLLLGNNRTNGFNFFFASFRKDQCKTWKREFYAKTARFSYPANNPAITFELSWPYGCVGMYWDQREEMNQPGIRNPDFEPISIVIEKYPKLLKYLLTKGDSSKMWDEYQKQLKEDANPELERARVRERQSLRESDMIAKAVVAAQSAKRKPSKKSTQKKVPK